MDLEADEINAYLFTLKQDKELSDTYFKPTYRKGGKQKSATLSGVEFLRRFASHILPPGLVRIRHYGFLAAKNKSTELNLAKKGLHQPEWQKIKYSWIEIAKAKLNYHPQQCPCCGKEMLTVIKVMEPERATFKKTSECISSFHIVCF